MGPALGEDINASLREGRQAVCAVDMWAYMSKLQPSAIAGSKAGLGKMRATVLYTRVKARTRYKVAAIAKAVQKDCFETL